MTKDYSENWFIQKYKDTGFEEKRRKKHLLFS